MNKNEERYEKIRNEKNQHARKLVEEYPFLKPFEYNVEGILKWEKITYKKKYTYVIIYLNYKNDIEYLKLGKTDNLEKRVKDLNGNQPLFCDLFLYAEGDIETLMQNELEDYLGATRIKKDFFICEDFEDTLITLQTDYGFSLFEDYKAKQGKIN